MHSGSTFSEDWPAMSYTWTKQIHLWFHPASWSAFVSVVHLCGSLGKLLYLTLRASSHKQACFWIVKWMLWRTACPSTDTMWASQLFWKKTVLLLHALFDCFCSSQKSLWWLKIHSFHKESIKHSPLSAWHRGMRGTPASHSAGSGRWKQTLCHASCQLCSMISCRKGS